MLRRAGESRRWRAWYVGWRRSRLRRRRRGRFPLAKTRVLRVAGGHDLGIDLRHGRAGLARPGTALQDGTDTIAPQTIPRACSSRNKTSIGAGCLDLFAGRLALHRGSREEYCQHNGCRAATSDPGPHLLHRGFSPMLLLMSYKMGCILAQSAVDGPRDTVSESGYVRSRGDSGESFPFLVPHVEGLLPGKRHPLKQRQSTN